MIIKITLMYIYKRFIKNAYKFSKTTKHLVKCKEQIWLNAWFDNTPTIMQNYGSKICQQFIEHEI